MGADSGSDERDQPQTKSGHSVRPLPTNRRRPAALLPKIMRQKGPGFWPRGQRPYKPHHELNRPDSADAIRYLADLEKTYGALDDTSSYAEYAWEFLRRNSFYQRMIDGTAPVELEHWGYRPTEHDEAHFGLTKRFSYRNRFSKQMRWEPLEWLLDSIDTSLSDASGPGGSSFGNGPGAPKKEVMQQYLTLHIDLTPSFGPGQMAVEMQFAVAKARVEAWIQASVQRFPPVARVKPSKATLRRYLAVADLLSTPLNAELAAEKWKWPDQEKIKDELWKVLAFHDADCRKSGNGPSAEAYKLRVYRYTQEAWAHVYQWHCLSLLTLDPV